MDVAWELPIYVDPDPAHPSVAERLSATLTSSG